jgi:hypothetical protein
MRVASVCGRRRPQPGRRMPLSSTNWPSGLVAQLTWLAPILGRNHGIFTGVLPRSGYPQPARQRRCAPSPLAGSEASEARSRGRGWGVLPQSRCQHESESLRSHPPPPTPPRRFAGGGGKRGLKTGVNSTPPASAKIPPASCRRRSARSTARSGRRGLLPATQADARAATSRAQRTSGGSGPAAIRPAREVQSSGCGAAPARAKPPGELRRGAVTGQSLRASRRSRTADPCCGCLLLPSSRAAQAAWQGGEPHAPAAAAYSVTGLSEICHSLPSKIEM